MKTKIAIFKKYNIPVLLFILVTTLSSLSFYNYNTQKTVLLEQMRSDALDTANSITAAMKRFRDIKSTMNLQRLINDISLGLEIFEFRYLEPDGVIRNSMFKDEIGKIHAVDSFKKTMQGSIGFGKFFFEKRDYVQVMAIYYPIYFNDRLIGIIDLAVDISEYQLIDGVKPEFSLMRRQVDVMNLLKSIEGSIHNSMEIFEDTDLYDFLHHYVDSAANIVQITVVDQGGKVLISSNNSIVGTNFTPAELRPPKLLDIDGRPVYRMVTEKKLPEENIGGQLMLLIDAAPYAKNEKQLLRTALITTAVALLFALFIAREIYFTAIENSRQEKERLEKLVKERTHDIELLSKTDALTGLWNRRYLEEMLEMEFKRARRYEHDLSILVVDLDHFKKVNDTYGHMAGDEVLRKTSDYIRECVRETDFVGRYGGEEIVVILPETSPDIAQTIANQIREVIATNSISFEESTLNITASIGISSLTAGHGSYQEVFGEADQALYLSKQQGRNRVSIYKSAAPEATA